MTMVKRPADLSRAEARRLSLAALGFAAPKPANPSIGHVLGVAERLGAIQIDSVNVLVRAHRMPAFSRLGPYPLETLEALAYKQHKLFEYWGHAACFLPMSLYPLFRFRMEGFQSSRWWSEATAETKEFIERVYAQVSERGPLSASEIHGGGKSTGSWWGWSEGKRALEMLFRLGRLAVSGRRNFERLYDLPERVLPAEVLRITPPPSDEARKRLLVIAAQACGIGTAEDLAGYFHIETWVDRTEAAGRRRSELPRLVAELVEAGRLRPTSVEGWTEQAYTVPGARVPKSMRVRALVSPFDPLLWERKPAQRLFDFDYKIEIYVPSAQRNYGYYVLPFLLGDQFAARVDLKADRKAQTLHVLGAFLEHGREADQAAEELALELRSMADWLGLETIVIAQKGDLAAELVQALR